MTEFAGHGISHESLIFARYTQEPLGKNVQQENTSGKWNIPLDLAISLAIMVYEPLLHTSGASEIQIDQTGFSRRKKLYCPDVNE